MYWSKNCQITLYLIFFTKYLYLYLPVFVDEFLNLYLDFKQMKVLVIVLKYRVHVLDPPVLHRFDFPGDITAFGSDDGTGVLTHIKAGPGTIYIQDGRSFSQPHTKLVIIGNTQRPQQKQTRTVISGSALDEFYFREVAIAGM